MSAHRTVHDPEPDTPSTRAYYASVPAPMVTATGLVTDQAGRVLVVTPTYKDHLELPGGLVTAEESPAEGLARELMEELELDVPVGRLLAVDTVPVHRHGRVVVMHMYAVGPLTPAQTAAIRFADGELSAAEFLTLEQAQQCLPPRLARRVAAGLHARATGTIVDIQAGFPEPGTSAAYAASRTQFWAGTAALVTDEDGRPLLVTPKYHADRDLLPSGAVESGESPHAACAREIAEELGLHLPLGRLLAVDWVPADTACIPEGMPFPGEAIFVFDGGTLTAAETAAICLPDDELSSWQFVDPAHITARMTPADGRRTLAALGARDTGTTVYLHDGHTVTCDDSQVAAAGSR